MAWRSFGGRHATVLVVCTGDRCFAVDHRCPHLGSPLHRGSVEDGILTCHWHHARFDLASGGGFDLCADDLPRAAVQVRDGGIWVSTALRYPDGDVHWQNRLRAGMENNLGWVIAKAIRGLRAQGVDPRELVRWLRHWTAARHRDGAERTLLSAIKGGSPPAELAEMMLVAATDRVFADGGREHPIAPADAAVVREDEGAYVGGNGPSNPHSPSLAAGAASASGGGGRPVGPLRRIARGVRRVALGIAEQIQREGAAALVGQEVHSAQDLADLAQVYRNPQDETVRVFFMQGNKIVHATGVTARFAGTAPLLTKSVAKTSVDQHAWFRNEIAADGVWLLQNHPSGNPTPGRADIDTTLDTVLIWLTWHEYK